MLEKSASKSRIPQSFFTDLADKDRITLFNTGQIRSIAARELLFKQGASDKTLYYVLGGTLVAEFRETDPIGFKFKPGDLIGEVSLAGNGGRISSVFAEEPSAVLTLDPAAFRTLSQVTQTAVLRRLYDTALSRMLSLEGKVEKARQQSASLTRHLKKSRKSLGKYEQSEIISNIVKSIPRLPLHITHLIDLLASERASAKDVADLAKQDPSLVVDILKAINSSRYSLAKEISDVSYAITYMGFNEVYQIAVSRGLMKSIPDSDEFREIYRHSLFLSFIAYELCQFYDKNRAPLLSTIALLHDIGETVILLLEKQNPKWSLFIEMLDPSKLGAMLLKHWNIPKQVCQTVEYQSFPLFCPPSEIHQDQKVNVSLLYVAHAVYDRLNQRPEEAFDHPFIEDYLHSLRFGAREIDQVVRDVVLSGLRAKSQRLPDFVRKRIAMSSLAAPG